jgi:hypothetical protein
MTDDKNMGPSDESKDELMKAKQAAAGDKPAADDADGSAKQLAQDDDTVVKK